MPAPIEICLFGAGRIGAIHAGNIASHPGARLKYVVDVNRAAAEALARRLGAQAIGDADQALADPEVGAVVIASSTNTHVDLITRSAKAKKATFCEKPIDLDLSRVDKCLKELKSSEVPFLIGFNRRFDPSFRALHDGVRRGEVGKVESVTIISRDPRPPPSDYVKVSGGLFRDMMIHDFDTARWLLGEEPVELFATASVLVDPAIGKANDVDTAMVTMKTASGVLCNIQNSRRAAYGYDQRIEVFGESGMLQAGNHLENTVERWGAGGTTSAKPLDFFLQRYADAYREEMDHFIQSLVQRKPPSPGPNDGRAALVLAEAAIESAKTRKAVTISPR